MINLFDKLMKYFILIKEAYGFKSKLSLLLYAPFVPFYYSTSRFNNAFLFDITMKNNNGILFCGKSMVAVHTAASFHEKMLKDYMKLSEGTFIDIGANIGKYSVYIAKMLAGKGKVLSIEPEPHNFFMLIKNITLNRLQNVEAYNGACYSEEKEVSFYTQEKGSGMHSLYKPDNDKFKEEIKVKTIRLDDLVDRLNLKDIRLIKLDAEGAEPEILKGAVRIMQTYHPDILFESWNDPIFKQCAEILNAYGYKITNLTELNHFANWRGK